MLRYEWVWYKSRCTGFLNARRAPLKKTENILVFYQKLPLYNPQFEQGKPYKKIAGNNGNSTNYGKFTRSGSGSEDGLRFPGNVLTFPDVYKRQHIANHGAYKEVYKKYASIGWKTRKEKFAAEHREELDAYLAAKRFFKAHQEELPFDAKELKKERAQLSEELSKKNEGLQAVQADMKLLRDCLLYTSQEILWKRKISAIMGIKHLTMERKAGSLCTLVISHYGTH